MVSCIYDYWLIAPKGIMHSMDLHNVKDEDGLELQDTSYERLSGINTTTFSSLNGSGNIRNLKANQGQEMNSTISLELDPECDYMVKKNGITKIDEENEDMWH